MTLSLRSIKLLMRQAEPKIDISQKAVNEMKSYLEKIVENITKHASKIQASENEMRRQVGDKIRQRLSCRVVKMAIRNRYPELKEDDYYDAEN